MLFAQTGVPAWVSALFTVWTHFMLFVVPLYFWAWNKNRVIGQLQNRMQEIQAKVGQLKQELEEMKRETIEKETKPCQNNH